jgi:uncharacterized membrane protein YtjA (UPF0391 family)
MRAGTPLNRGRSATVAVWAQDDLAETQMLKWALLFLALAIAAALAPTAGLNGAEQSAAKVLCFASLALFVVMVGLGGASRRI